MLMAAGFLRQVFEVFKRYHTPVDLIATSEVSISLTIDDVRAPGGRSRPTSRSSARCGSCARWRSSRLVGRGFFRYAGPRAADLRRPGDVNVVMISFAASDVNISVVVEEQDAERAVHALHREFFTEPARSGPASRVRGPMRQVARLHRPRRSLRLFLPTSGRPREYHERLHIRPGRFRSSGTPAVGPEERSQMAHPSSPRAQGLYDPRYEHDACGVGFVVDLQGPQVARHRRARRSQVLLNLEHRGACGCEKNTGDGAGILMQMPHAFLAEECDEARHSRCPAPGELRRRHGLPADRRPRPRAAARSSFEQVVREEGQRFLGWRDVPDRQLARSAPTARAAEPVIRQVFIGRGPTRSSDDDAFERKLYVIRSRVENAVRASTIPEQGACSTSRACRTGRSSTRGC